MTLSDERIAEIASCAANEWLSGMSRKGDIEILTNIIKVHLCEALSEATSPGAITVRFDNSFMEALRGFSDRQDKPIEWLIKQALRHYQSIVEPVPKESKMPVITDDGEIKEATSDTPQLDKIKRRCDSHEELSAFDVMSPDAVLVDRHREALEFVHAKAMDAPELNMSNYDHEQVGELNNAMVEICLYLDKARNYDPIP